jgi:hypothetical protein
MSNDHDEIIEHLKAQAAAAAGGRMVVHESAAMDPSLREALGMPALDPDEGSAWHIDILGGCSEQDIALRLKHYADEAMRQHWRSDFPDYDLPDHVDPPYDRDRYLPPYEERSTSVERE